MRSASGGLVGGTCRRYKTSVTANLSSSTIHPVGSRGGVATGTWGPLTLVRIIHLARLASTATHFGDSADKRLGLGGREPESQLERWSQAS